MTPRGGLLALLRCSTERIHGPHHADTDVAGDERLSGNDKAEDRRTGAEEPDSDGGKKRRRKSPAPSGEISKALRTVYDETLREDVPDDFMDLLGKLS